MILKNASDANVHDGFPIKGSDAKSGNSNVKTQVNNWLNNIGINIVEDETEENIINDDSEDKSDYPKENILNDDSSNENSNEINLYIYDDSSYLYLNNLFLILLLIID